LNEFYTRAIQIPVVVLLTCIATTNRVAAQDHDQTGAGSSDAWSFATDANFIAEIFGLGAHPAGLINHPRNFSQIDALTLGYVRDLPMLGWARLGIGADVTVYRTSQDLVEYYGSPKSYHVFLRWRPSGATPAHIH